MKNGLSVVDPTFGCNGNDYVLIQKGGIIGRCLDVATADKYLPRARAKKLLSWRGYKCGSEPPIGL